MRNLVSGNENREPTYSNKVPEAQRARPDLVASLGLHPVNCARWRTGVCGRPLFGRTLLRFIVASFDEAFCTGHVRSILQRHTRHEAGNGGWGSPPAGDKMHLMLSPACLAAEL
jgi:hypothetical protein